MISRLPFLCRTEQCAYSAMSYTRKYYMNVQLFSVVFAFLIINLGCLELWWKVSAFSQVLYLSTIIRYLNMKFYFQPLCVSTPTQFGGKYCRTLIWWPQLIVTLLCRYFVTGWCFFHVPPLLYVLWYCFIYNFLIIFCMYCNQGISAKACWQWPSQSKIKVNNDNNFVFK